MDGCITRAITAFFRAIVVDALNPLLDLLSTTLLTTPPPSSLPRVGALWNNSWQILLASYGVLVIIAGIVVMAHETIQTRHSIKQIAPRIVVGFLAGASSLWVTTTAITIANSLSVAVMGDGLEADSASQTLKNLIPTSVDDGIFLIILGIIFAAMLVMVLVGYVVRVTLTIILIAGAPLALMFHALPQTEGIARWWWKAFGGCLAIQVLQSLTLITALKVFLAPGGFTPLGPTRTGLVNMLVAFALLYILFKIPFWVLSSVNGGGRTLAGSIIRGFIAYKALGLLRGTGTSRSSGHGRGGTGQTKHPPNPGPEGNGGGRGPTAPPNLVVGDGQHTKPPPDRTRPPRMASPPRPLPRASRHQPAIADDPPTNAPRPGRDPSLTGTAPTGHPNSRRPRANRPQSLPSSESRTGTRPDGPGHHRGTPHHDVNPNKQPANSSAKPPGTRPSSPTPPTPPRSVPRAGKQLRLPLDLPNPPHRTPPAIRPAPPRSSAGGKTT